jgi:peptidylprolyl isomerase
MSKRVDRADRTKGFYNGIVFHRVIEGFMAQGGRPDRHRHGRFGPAGSCLAEFTMPKRSSTRGMRSAAARTSDPNSVQLAVLHHASPTAPHLDGQYTVWGKCRDGHGSSSTRSRRGPASQPIEDPDQIISAKIEYK